MYDASRHLHFTRALEHFSLKLDELLTDARQHSSNPSFELLDEIAYVTGELIIVLTNHDGHQEGSIKEVLLLAQTLRQHLRSNQLRGEHLVQAFDPFREKIDGLLGRHKRAA